MNGGHFVPYHRNEKYPRRLKVDFKRVRVSAGTRAGVVLCRAGRRVGLEPLWGCSGATFRPAVAAPTHSFHALDRLVPQPRGHDQNPAARSHHS